MKFSLTRDYTFGSWTAAIESRRFHEFMPGTPHPRFGVALLYYAPAKRLSVSLWAARLGSSNIRLWGPKRLPWETAEKDR